MAVIIESAVLSRALKSAAAIVEGANTIPVLANVRLEAIGAKLEIVTSNLEIEFRQLLPLVSGEGLATTVDARKFAAITGAVESGAQIALEEKDGWLTVKSGRSRWVLPVIPISQFPDLPFEAEADGIDMPGKDLASVIARTAWSTSVEAAKYYIAGIYFNEEGGRLRVASTNGFTLFVLDTATAWPKAAPDVIVPTKYARLLERLAGEASRVDLLWDDKKIRATIGDVTLTGKLIEGIFPDYRRLIPKAGDAPLVTDPESLRKALRRIELVGTEKSRAIVFEPGMGLIDLRMSDYGSASEASEQVPADCEGGNRTGFNVAFLAGALEAVGGETVEIHQEDAGSIALIRRTVPDGAICGVMPMSV